MPIATVSLASIAGTEAAAGWAAGHTLVVDRPDGVAGGQGLGFNGAQLLAFAIGGCLCNDLRYAAHARGVGLGRIVVSVALDLEGDPLVATGCHHHRRCGDHRRHRPGDLVASVRAISMASNSVSRGFPVTLKHAS
jgi:organic hydroperoxide reductase OsmC/OhrA